MATAKENVRIRSAPSTSGGVLSQLKKGETAQVVARSAANDWLQIIVPGTANTRGWIAAEFASVSVPLAGIPVAQGSLPAAAVPTITIPPAAPASTPDSSPPTFTLPPATAVQAVDPPDQSTTPPLADVERPAPSNPLVPIVIALVMLGLGGGFVLVLFGTVVTFLGRK